MNPERGSPYWDPIVGDDWPEVPPSDWDQLAGLANDAARDLNTGDIAAARKRYSEMVHTSLALDPIKSEMLDQERDAGRFADALGAAANTFAAFGDLTRRTRNQILDVVAAADRRIQQVQDEYDTTDGKHDKSDKQQENADIQQIIADARNEVADIVSAALSSLSPQGLPWLDEIASDLGEPSPWLTSNGGGHGPGPGPGPGYGGHPPGAGPFGTGPYGPGPYGPPTGGYQQTYDPGPHGPFRLTSIQPPQHDGQPNTMGPVLPSPLLFGGQTPEQAPDQPTTPTSDPTVIAPIAGGQTTGTGNTPASDPSTADTPQPGATDSPANPADQAVSADPNSAAGSSAQATGHPETTSSQPGDTHIERPPTELETQTRETPTDVTAQPGMPIGFLNQPGIPPPSLSVTPTISPTTPGPATSAPETTVPDDPRPSPARPGPTGSPTVTAHHAGRPAPHVPDTSHPTPPPDSSAAKPPDTKRDNVVRDAIGAALVADRALGSVMGDRVDGDLVLAKTLVASIRAAVDADTIGVDWAVAVLRHATGVSAFVTTNEGRGWLPAGLYLPREVATPWQFEVSTGAGWEGLADPARILAEFATGWGSRSGARLAALASSVPIDPLLRKALRDVPLAGSVPAAANLDLTTPSAGTTDRLGITGSTRLLQRAADIPDGALGVRVLEFAVDAHMRVGQAGFATTETLGVTGIRHRLLRAIRQGREFPGSWWEELSDLDDMLLTSVLARRAQVGRVPLGEIRLDETQQSDLAVLRAVTFQRRCNELTFLLREPATRQIARDAVYIHAHLLGDPLLARPTPPNPRPTSVLVTTTNPGR